MFSDDPEFATIVVCEDDEATLDLLCDHLVADRFEVLPAPSAADALRLCRYNNPEQSLLDLSADASPLPHSPT
jgi:DNA-binding response OmpR family regulator